MQILVVEESESNRKFISFALKMQGNKVITATDGMEALEKLSNNKIDLLITELNLSNIDGYKLIEQIRKIKEYKKLPIIVLTTLTKENEIKQGLESGADSYLLKPFNYKRIQFEVSKYLTN